MRSRHNIIFIDKEKEKISDLFVALQRTFSNPLHHITDEQDFSRRIRQDPHSIVFIDVSLTNRINGLTLLKNLSRNTRHILIAVLPEKESPLIPHVFEINPFFFITKPYNPSEITFTLNKALDRAAFLHKAYSPVKEGQGFCGIIGHSSIMKQLFDLIARVAEDDYATVLIRGDSGTGKELVAKAIHSQSSRKNHRFVPVNCAAIPDDLLESELFGYVKGAFTGATAAKQGRIQFADGGTLFLDEIGDMKPTLQAKLLRVLQEKEFEPVGGLQATPVNTRILAATHCDLEQLVNEGKFREDLYYRLSVIPLHIPPLSERKEDIPRLIEFFIAHFTKSRGRDSFLFEPKAMEALLRYKWPGNVRELENLIQHMSILFSGQKVKYVELPEKYTLPENLTDEDVSSLLTSQSTETEDFSFDGNFFEDSISLSIETKIDFNELINNYEKTLIVKALKATNGNKKEAARLLSLKRTTLLEKIKKKKLSTSDW